MSMSEQRTSMPELYWSNTALRSAPLFRPHRNTTGNPPTCRGVGGAAFGAMAHSLGNLVEFHRIIRGDDRHVVVGVRLAHQEHNADVAPRVQRVKQREFRAVGFMRLRAFPQVGVVEADAHASFWSRQYVVM